MLYLSPRMRGGGMEPCYYPHFDAFLARGCGRQHKAWGVAQRNPRYDQDLSRKPADAGDSHWLYDDEMANNKKLPPASRARCAVTQYSWGSAFGSTPGYTLSPASAGSE